MEQLRLTIIKQDFVRAAIVAGKINRKHLQEMAHYKIQFYTLLSTIHRHEKNALELVKDYHAIYLTHVPSMKENKTDNTADSNNNAMDVTKEDETHVTSSSTTPATSWSEAMKAVIVFLLLAPYSNEQQDVLHRIAIDTNLEKITSYQYVFALVGFCSWTTAVCDCIMTRNSSPHISIPFSFFLNEQSHRTNVIEK